MGFEVRGVKRRQHDRKMFIVALCKQHNITCKFVWRDGGDSVELDGVALAKNAV